MEEIQSDILVIGGGASGLMAAGIAANEGAGVVLLEKMQRPARKLRITGKGRCNLTNTCDVDTFIEHIGREGRFLRNCFSEFFNTELISFFENLSVKTVAERGGRVFPENGDAGKLTDALIAWAHKSRVQIYCNEEADKLVCSDGIFRYCHSSSGKKFTASACILSTGGFSYPLTGSTGDGFRIAEELGLHVIAPQPVLVPLTISCSVALPEQTELKNVGIKVYRENKLLFSAMGDITFNGEIVEGPLILSLSRKIATPGMEYQQLMLTTDFKPALEHDVLDRRLLREIAGRSGETLYSLMRGLLPAPMVIPFIAYCDLDPSLKTEHISAGIRKTIRMALKDFRFSITGNSGFERAVITRGGVDTKEIDPRSMAVKSVPNLFITGELLNLDADTGGYNLQIAFSTGHLAGISAASLIKG